MPNDEMESRIMKVTMPKDDWEDYDSGKTYSNKGMRYSEHPGQMTTQPDISPIDETDRPKREIVREKIVYREASSNHANIWMIICSTVLTSAMVLVGTNPSVQKKMHDWKEKINSKVGSFLGVSSGKASQQCGTSLPAVSANPIQVSEKTDAFQTESFVATQAQADAIVAETKAKVQELANLLYLLSRIYIKDEKSGEERKLEEEYIDQLLSEEATSAMRQVIENRQALAIDDETVASFNDFLNGYIRNGAQLIPIHRDEEDD